MQEPQAALGFTRTPSENDPRRDPVLLAALERIAPGTDLRQAIDDIIRSREGALIVIGDPNELSFLFSGGMRLDQPFTPQFLYELAKMDGAIIVNSTLTKLAFANVQLMPDPTIPSNETGTRHRTAERVASRRVRSSSRSRSSGQPSPSTSARPGTSSTPSPTSWPRRTRLWRRSRLMGSGSIRS